MARNKDGLREQYLSSAKPETMYITGGDYKGVVLINKDDFDKKNHVRVNVHGQPIDAGGALIPVVDTGTKTDPATGK